MVYFNVGNIGDLDLVCEVFYILIGDMFIYCNDEDGECVDIMNLGDFVVCFGCVMFDWMVIFYDIMMVEGCVVLVYIIIDWVDGCFVDDMFLFYKIDG